MFWGRRRCTVHRVIPYGVGAAVGAARSGYYAARGAIGRWRKKLSFGRKAKYVQKRRMKRRHNRTGKFLRTIGLTQSRVVTLVYRGCTIKNGPTNANFTDIMYWRMNNPRDPGYDTANVGTPWLKCATGFDHMSSLYKYWRVLGAAAYVSIKPARVVNIQKATSGTTTYDTMTTVPMKCGLVIADVASAAAEGVASWDEAYMRDDPTKTCSYTLTEPLRGARLKVYYNAKRWAQISMGLAAGTVGTRTTNCSASCYCDLWMQVADKASAPTQTQWIVSWTIKYRTRFSEFQGPEADMKETTVPS